MYVTDISIQELSVPLRRTPVFRSGTEGSAVADPSVPLVILSKLVSNLMLLIRGPRIDLVLKTSSRSEDTESLKAVGAFL